MLADDDDDVWALRRQISVKNRQYASVKEWIEAEIADQRKERKRLERAAHLRLKKVKPRSLLHR